MLQLIVADGVLDSTPDTVIVTTTNSVPVARAGDDQTAAPDDDGPPERRRFDRCRRRSADLLLGDRQRPERQQRDAQRCRAATDPTFVADLAGTYVAQLIVSDGHRQQRAGHRGDHRPPANRAPVAPRPALTSRSNVGVIVQLNGTES